jgi:hypothetical protein
VPDDDFLRSTLRDQWHLSPSDMTVLPPTVMSRGWEFTAGGEVYVTRLVDLALRQSVEAGLAVATHLRACRIDAGEPVRTLGGALTVATPHGVLAVLRRLPGRRLDGRDPVDQQWWGERLGAVHRCLQHFRHPGLRPWQLLDADAAHLDADPWLHETVTAAVAAATRLAVTDRLTYGVLHGDPSPEIFAYAGGPEGAGEFLDGYLAAGPVGGDELDAALPVLLRLRWAVQAVRAARFGCAAALGTAREALGSMPG